ncbi:MAG: serine hydrolase domain-containing protein [Sulfitobacter sp.]
MIRSALFGLALLATPAVADVSDRVGAAFRDWVSAVDVSQGALTLWRGNRLVQDVAIGIDPNAARPLASLSKAVTGVCVATMVKSGLWSLSTTSAQVLGYGAEGITISALLTHSSGLGPDSTQGLGLLGLFKRDSADASLSARALGRTLQTDMQGAYQYNNENYAVLGAMITARTGENYDTYCRRAVLDPAGVTTAKAYPPLRGLLSFGGWEMSVQDYARFMNWAYGPDGIIGGDIAAWPAADLGGGAYYGVGMIQRAFRGSHNFWHFGLLCFPGRANAGSYTVSWMQDWRAVVAFERCLDWDQLSALDAALSGAVFD